MFQAPEAVEKGEFDQACDVYSFGILLWRSFHRLPTTYTNNTIKAGVMLEVNDKLKFRTIGLEKLYTRCTAKAPSERPPMAEVTAELFAIFSAYRLAEGWTGPAERWTGANAVQDETMFALGPPNAFHF